MIYYDISGLFCSQKCDFNYIIKYIVYYSYLRRSAPSLKRAVLRSLFESKCSFWESNHQRTFVHPSAEKEGVDCKQNKEYPAGKQDGPLRDLPRQVPSAHDGQARAHAVANAAT